MKFLFFIIPLFLVFIQTILSQQGNGNDANGQSSPPPTPDPTPVPKRTKVIVQTLTQTGEATTVIKSLITTVEVDPTSSIESKPSASESSTNKSEESNNNNGTMTIVWVVVGIASAVVFFGLLAFLLRRLRKKSKEEQFPDALNMMAASRTNQPIVYQTDYGNSNRSFGTNSNNQSSISRLRNHESEQVFLKQLNEP